MNSELLSAIQSDIPLSVSRALAEDIGSGDITAQLIPEDKQATAVVISREAAVICGRPWVDEVFAQLDKNTEIEWHIDEGDSVEANQKLFTLTGNARVSANRRARRTEFFADSLGNRHRRKAICRPCTQ